MAYVPDKPVRIREFLADGTAHDVTVALVPEEDNIQVLDDQEATAPGGSWLEPVYYDEKQAAELKGASKGVKAAAKVAATDESKNEVAAR